MNVTLWDTSSDVRKELSIQDDRTESDNRIEVMLLIGIAENNLPHIARWESTKPPYAEPHVRWCGRSVNVKIGGKCLLWLAFTSYPIVDGIDEETMDGFFKCALDESLVVVNMRQVLQLLYALSIEKMIPHNWVSLIADNQLLTPKSTGKASKRGAISSRLSELKASSAKFPSGEFLDFAKQLKEMRWSKVS